MTDEKKKHLFKPGQSGNPSGRPKGARNKLTEDFLDKLSKDFEQNGKEAIEMARIEKPIAYLQVIAKIIPKEHNVNGEVVIKSASVQRLEQFLAEAANDGEERAIKDITPERPVLPAKVRAK